MVNGSLYSEENLQAFISLDQIFPKHLPEWRNKTP